VASRAQLRLITVLGKSVNLIRVLTMVYRRPNYISGQDDVPTRTEECLCVRSKNRHEADRDERLARPYQLHDFVTLHVTLHARLA
jgi:hypothetical protein